MFGGPVHVPYITDRKFEMFLRMNKALNDRRAGIKREEGFTLIELLVVVIIIGILAAIAIPIYIGVQNSAKDSAVQTDLANAKIAIIAYSTDNPASAAVPTLSTGVLGKYGFTQSSYTVANPIVADATPPTWPAFCIQAPKASDTAQNFHVTDSLGVTTGACP